MGRLLILFLALPWWAFFPIAIGAGVGGEVLYKQAKETEERRLAALNAPPPALVDLSEFSREQHITEAKEVNVRGWIDTEHNYVLETYDGARLAEEHFLFLLFGTNQDYDAREVRAALVLEEHELDLFVDNMDNYVIGEMLDAEPVFAFNGFASRFNGESGMVKDAIADEGLVMGPNFVYLEPFWEGREVGLTADALSGTIRQMFWVIAGVCMLIGVAKRMLKKEERAGRNADGSLTFGKPAAAAKKQESFSPAMATQGSALASGIDPNSPIGRMAAKRAEASGANDHNVKAEQKIAAHVAATSGSAQGAQPARKGFENPLMSVLGKLRGADQSPKMANVRRVMIVGAIAIFGYQAFTQDGPGLMAFKDVGASDVAAVETSLETPVEAPVVEVKMTALEAVQDEVPAPVTRAETSPSQMPLIPSNIVPDNMMPRHLMPGMAPAAASGEPAPVEVASGADTPVSAPVSATADPATSSANPMVKLAIKLMLGAVVIIGLWRLSQIVRASMGSRQTFCPDEVMGMPREAAEAEAAQTAAPKAAPEMALAAHERTARADRPTRPARAPRRVSVGGASQSPV